MNKFRLPEAFLVALKAVNVDPPFLFRKSGLPPTLCSSGDGMISTEQNFRLWHTLREISDDPAIGLRMATLNVRHPPNMAAQHARTFGDALVDLARSTMLSFSEETRIVKTKNECSIEFTRAMLNEGAPVLFLDTAFALMLETGRRGTQQRLHALRVELTRPVSHQEVYEAHFGCCVRFKARRNVIVFRTGDLELPFATYNAKLLARLRFQLDREIARLKTRETTSFRAKLLIVRNFTNRGNWHKKCLWLEGMTNDKIVNLVAALMFVAIVVSRPALRYFARLPLTGAKRFFSLIRRCSLRSDEPKVFLPFRFG